MQQLELVCLGVGAGKTMVYDGEVSSSFLLRAREPSTPGHEQSSSSKAKGLLLIDCGFGTVRACLQHADAVPPLIFITHNHSDHAAELPVVLAVECKRPGGTKRTVVAERSVVQLLKERRLHEAEVCMSCMGAFDADWIICDEGQRVPIGYGLAITVLGPCQHTELCFGFLLHRAVDEAETGKTKYETMFGFTGDSGFSGPLLQQLSEAPLIVADARKVGTYEHAGFDELRQWKINSAYEGRFIIYHYGTLAEAPDEKTLGVGLELAKPGDIVAHWQHVTRSHVREQQEVEPSSKRHRTGAKTA